MTIKEALKYSYNTLKQAGIARPEFEAELILSSILDLDRSQIIANHNQEINSQQLNKIKTWAKKRTKHYPLAYLTGYKSFYGLDFTVNKHTLVPRPESELFIEYLKDKDFNNSLVIDVGTGSGCLIISLIKNLNLDIFSNYQFLATDISKSALKVANKNAQKHNAQQIEFQRGNLLSPVLSSDIIDNKEKVYILANLPYVSREIYKNSHSIKKEPKSALVSKNNGLSHYFKLLQQIKTIKDKKLMVLLEINPEQADVLTQYIQQNFLGIKIQIFKDLSNKNRLIVFSN